MLQDILQNSRNELIKAVSKNNHPYRFFSLATDNNGSPALRTVVIRAVNSDFLITFYTDSRSDKVNHILRNPQVCALFYNPDTLIQLRLEGHAQIELDKNLLHKKWKNINENSRKDYTTNKPPGSSLKNPDAITYLNNDHYFCSVTINTEKIEYLRLKRPNHIRAQFIKEKDSWQGSFLVP